MEDVIQSENEKMKNIDDCSVLDIQVNQELRLNLGRSNQMIIFESFLS